MRARSPADYDSSSTRATAGRNLTPRRPACTHRVTREQACSALTFRSLLCFRSLTGCVLSAVIVASIPEDVHAARSEAYETRVCS